MFNFIVGVDIHGHAVYVPTPHPSEAEVATFEQRIGQRLPEDYRQFLLDRGWWNGGSARG